MKASAYPKRSICLPSKSKPRFSEQLKNFSPRPVKSDLIVPDCGLHRVDILSMDKHKYKQEVLNNNKSRDISYFYESIRAHSPVLSPVNDLMPYPLPSDLGLLKALLESEEYKTDSLLKTISKPYSRKDAENLSEWLSEMHGKHLGKFEKMMEEAKNVSEEMMEMVETVYLTAFKELIKQTATNCYPRAQMLVKILKVLRFLWKKNPNEANNKIAVIKENYQKELTRHMSMTDFQKASLYLQIEELHKSIEEHKKENELLVNEVNILKHYLSQIHAENRPKQIEKQFVLKVNLRPACFHKFVQTDKIEVQSSSSEENEVAESTDPTNSGAFYTRMHTDMLEKKNETIEYLKRQIEIAKCSEEFNAENLYEYINKEFYDCYAWMDGFRTSSQYFLKKETEEIRDQLENELKDAKINIEKKKQYGKSASLRYKPTRTMAQYITENSPVDYILSYLFGLSPKKINKITTMTTKKLSTRISHYLNLTKTKDFESFSSYGVFIYSEVFQHYNIKHIANRKFKELVACCLKHSDDPKIKLFLLMLTGPRNIGLSGFSTTVVKFCIKVYEFMEHDKTGILIEDLSQHTDLYPTVRGLECIKHCLTEYLTETEVHSLAKSVMEMSRNDPEDINKLGLIDLHSFVLLIAERFNLYYEEAIKSVKIAVTALTEYSYLTFAEASLLLRNISKKNISKEFSELKNEFSETEGCDILHFAQICFSKGLLKHDETLEFFKNNTKNVDEIQKTIKTMAEELPSLLKSTENLIETLAEDEWNSKLDDVSIWLKGKHSEKAFSLFHLLHSEFTFLFTP
jgi:hypothetical protein